MNVTHLRGWPILIFIVWLWIVPLGNAPVNAAPETSPVISETYPIVQSVADTSGMTAGTQYLGPHTAPKPFNGIQITWTTTGNPEAISLSLATQQAGLWSEFTVLTHVDEFLLPDAPPGTQTSTIFALEPVAEAWQIRITPNSNTKGSVTSIRVTTMDTRIASESSIVLPNGLEPRAGGSKPAIVARKKWGDATVNAWDARGLAGMTANATWMPTDAEIAKPTHLIIHHTATPNDGPRSDWPARVRQIWGYHTITNNWGDIGYHFLIDPNGVIYEGRFNGVRSDGTVIDGAHDYGFNRGTIGISMLGTFDKVKPSAKASTALNNLIAYLMTTYRIRPATTAFYAHQNVTLNTILGHRDAQLSGRSTGCPGNKLHDLLPGIRTAARNNVGKAPSQTWLTGVQVVDADVMVGEPVIFRMTISNAYADLPISGAAFTFHMSDTGYIYQMNECWAKQDKNGLTLFPKANQSSNRSARFRVMAGISNWDASFAKSVRACPVTTTENHPWRWSIGTTTIGPSGTHVVTGGVRFTRPGTYTVSFGVMKDWIGYPDNPCRESPSYAACSLFPKTLTVRLRTAP